MWYLILVPVLILFLLLLVAPVKVHVNYVFEEKDELKSNTTLNISSSGTGVSLSLLWGLFKPRLRFPPARLVFDNLVPVFKLRFGSAGYSGNVWTGEKTGASTGRAIYLYKQLMRVYRATAPVYRYLLSVTKLHMFSWRTRLGLSRADQTGWAVGLLWIMKGNSTAYLYRRLKKTVSRPELEIIPVFNARQLDMRIKCVFSLRPVHIIAAGVMMARLWLKNRKKLF